MHRQPAHHRLQSGLTLIEVLVALAIIGILSAIAVPNYRDYVTRGRLVEAFSALGALQPSAEQFWSNNRTYAGLDAVAANAFPANTTNFTFALTSANASSYLVTATGRAGAADFVYTIDQQGNKATTRVPTGWTANASCWVDRKGGACSQ